MAKTYNYSEQANNTNKVNAYLAHRKKCREIASDGLISFDEILDIFAQNSESTAINKIEKLKDERSKPIPYCAKPEIPEPPAYRAKPAKPIKQPRKKREFLCIGIKILKYLRKEEMDILQLIADKYAKSASYNVDSLMICIRDYGNALLKKSNIFSEYPAFRRKALKRYVALIFEGEKKAIIHLKEKDAPTFTRSNKMSDEHEPTLQNPNPLP